MGNAQSQGRGQGKGGEQSRVSPGDSLQEEMESLAIIPDVIVTRDELMRYTGSQHEKRIYLCCKNIVYDVTSARDFYGPEGPYAFRGERCIESVGIDVVENRGRGEYGFVG